MYKVPFNARLREAMKLRGINQTELAYRSKISKSMISEYLQGKYLPKQDKIFKLASVLEINESWLMGFEADLERTNEEYSVITDRSDDFLIINLIERLVDIQDRPYIYVNLYSDVFKSLGNLNVIGVSKVISYIDDLTQNENNTKDLHPKRLIDLK